MLFEQSYRLMTIKLGQDHKNLGDLHPTQELKTLTTMPCYATQVSLCLTWSETPKSVFLALWLICASSRENQIFAYAKTKAQISYAVTAQLISAFVFD